MVRAARQGQSIELFGFLSRAAGVRRGRWLSGRSGRDRALSKAARHRQKRKGRVALLRLCLLHRTGWMVGNGGEGGRESLGVKHCEKYPFHKGLPCRQLLRRTLSPNGITTDIALEPNVGFYQARR